MSLTETEAFPDLVALTADVVSAYVANNSVPVGDLPTVIASVHTSLRGLSTPQSAAAEPDKPKPPVPIKKTVTPDYIVSLEDGRQYKSLKRHLGTRGLTPDEYRAKWGLPKDYPMVAPNYAKARSDLAKSMGLGRKALSARDEAASAPAEAGAAKAKRRGPARRKAAAE